MFSLLVTMRPRLAYPYTGNAMWMSGPSACVRADGGGRLAGGAVVAGGLWRAAAVRAGGLVGARRRHGHSLNHRNHRRQRQHSGPLRQELRQQWKQCL